MAGAGLIWTILDDTHVQMAGLDDAAQDELRVDYRLRNEGPAALALRFVREWNANLDRERSRR